MSQTLQLNGPSLTLSARLVPWDEAAFGFPVAQIDDINVLDAGAARKPFTQFTEWAHRHGARIVSVRLPHDRLKDSMFLEAQGFRFIEMVLHPEMKNLQAASIGPDSLCIDMAQEADLRELINIAEHAFGYERYHIDPRLDSRLGDVRYGRWIANALHDPVQRLQCIRDDDRMLGFFITEHRQEGVAYWHLTAIATTWQGQGYGQRVWRAMIRHHQTEGCKSVLTTISARNVAVLNLYAKLGFGFRPPEMTFHWVRARE